MCEVPDVAPPTVPALPPLPTWVDRDLDESSSVQSESCWGEMEDRNDEEVEEWGLMPPPAAVHEGREVPQVASQVPVPSHRQRIPSRRLVLVGGRGSQNCQSQAQEDLLGETASPLHSQVGWAQAVRAPLQADQGRFALACIDGSDDVVATQPADTPQPHGVEQEQPYQRRRLRLLSQSRVGVGTQFHTITSDAGCISCQQAGSSTARRQ